MIKFNIDYTKLKKCVSSGDMYKILGIMDYITNGTVTSIEQVCANKQTLDKLLALFIKNGKGSRDKRLRGLRTKYRETRIHLDFLAYAPTKDETVDNDFIYIKENTND